MQRTALVAAPVMAEYDRECGSRRVYDVIRFLCEAGWKVTFFCLRPPTEDRYVAVLRQMGVAVHSGVEDIEDRLFRRETFDVAYISFWYAAEEVIPLLRRHAPQTRIVLDSQDLAFLRGARRIFGELARGERSRMLDAHYGDEFVREFNTYIASDVVLGVSEKETALINDVAADPGLAVHVPLTEDLDPSPRQFGERRGVLFVGNFLHRPNGEAVAHLCREVVPKLPPALLEEHPIFIVGNGLDHNIRRHAAGLAGVKMIGWVPDLVPYYQQARVAVAPLLSGAGTKGKIIHALATVTPTVSTTIGTEGLDLVDGEHVLVADGADAFAGAIERLLTDEALWNDIGRNGFEHVQARHGRAAVAPMLANAISLALSRPPKASALGDQIESRLPSRLYESQVERVRATLPRALPPGVNVAVVNKGDERFLDLDDLDAHHFPEARDGSYLGYHPVDSAAAIACLEDQRQRGAEFLVIPDTYAWWLEHYNDLRLHLEGSYRVALRDAETCVVYALHSGDDILCPPRRPDPTPTEAAAVAAPVQRIPNQEYVELRDRIARFVASAVPSGSPVLVVSKGDDDIVNFDGIEGWHFPRAADGSYAGFYPADDNHAVTLLKEQRRLGANHLVVPESASWWLDHYKRFAEYLATNSRSVVREEGVGVLYNLRLPASEPVVPSPPALRLRAPSDRVIEALRPVAVPRRTQMSGTLRHSVLVAGIYLAAEETNAEDIVRQLASARDCEVVQQWIALGGPPPTEALADVTTRTVLDRVPKFKLLNDMLETVDLDSFDYVVVADDDVVLPREFLDQFIALQDALGFSLAQPARTSRSFIDHPIVEQQPGVLARQTLFVEVGPVFSVARDAFDLVFPFDLTSAMGWGFENVWAKELPRRGLRLGIIDAVPVDHSLRKPVAHYNWSDADRGRTELWQARDHLPLDECYRVLDVVPIQQQRST